jgi:putative restriction endonuclease
VTDYLLSTTAGILVTRRHADYKDRPWALYHFPKARYLARITSLLGKLVLIFEPRRGGTETGAVTGGRSAFIGFANLGDCWDDPDDATHAFVELRGGCEFASPVGISRTKISGQSLQHAVREIDYTVAESIIRLGMVSPLSGSAARAREGLVDLSVPEEVLDRPLREVISNRLVRDASFRFRVVESVYQGRCALTGFRLLNGGGRAEVDAAHIRPVARGGPDTVRNGIALTKTIHWAFDRGLVTLGDDYRVLTVERGLDDEIRRLVSPSGFAILPQDVDDRPHPSYLSWHRLNVFKGSAA